MAEMNVITGFQNETDSRGDWEDTDDNEEGESGETKDDVYRDKTSEEYKEHYQSKLEYSEGVDPYQIPTEEWTTDLSGLPSTDHDNVGRYLMWTPGPLMKPDIGSYTSLELYKMVEDGRLHDMELAHLDGCENCDSHIVVTAKISNAEGFEGKTLQPWMIAEDSGIILSAHCDCSDGLIISCDHLSALLFAIIDKTDPIQRMYIEQARKRNTRKGQKTSKNKK